MAAIFKNLFRRKKATKEKISEETMDNERGSEDHETEGSANREPEPASRSRGRRRKDNRVSYCDDRSATAAYHTETKRQFVAGPRSCPGGEVFDDEDDHPDSFNRSYDDLRLAKRQEKDRYRSSRRSARKNSRHSTYADKISASSAFHAEIRPRSYGESRAYLGDAVSEEYDRFEAYNRLADYEGLRRRGFSKSSRSRYLTSDYDSGDLSSNFLCDPNLDDSESDGLGLERRHPRNFRSEKALQKKLRKYKEVMMMMHNEMEVLKHKNKEDVCEREKLTTMVRELQAKLNRIEIQNACPVGIPMAGPLMTLKNASEAGSAFCEASISSFCAAPRASNSHQQVRLNNSEASNPDEADEVKIFRNFDDIEMGRDAPVPGPLQEEIKNTTLLRSDDSDKHAGSNLSRASTIRRAQSDTKLFETDFKAFQ